ncbi:hypothetical protein KFK09_005668 [Dendrobium nobile]|uniref:Uncharacterized protein n=1 Tax=Dendrobium nobile TaxID=94219 RepID=A0A8T3C165_DENNO|nr:hypothetical protein KFK09_005668 [Dendrobium nobile]
MRFDVLDAASRFPLPFQKRRDKVITFRIPVAAAVIPALRQGSITTVLVCSPFLLGIIEEFSLALELFWQYLISSLLGLEIRVSLFWLDTEDVRWVRLMFTAGLHRGLSMRDG